MRGCTSWPCCRSRTALSAAAMARLLFGKLNRSSRSFFMKASSSSVGDGCAAAASVTGGTGCGCAVAASVLAGLDSGARSASSAWPTWVVRSRRRRIGACPLVDTQGCSSLKGALKQPNSAAVLLAHTNRRYHTARHMLRGVTPSLLLLSSLSLSLGQLPLKAQKANAPSFAAIDAPKLSRRASAGGFSEQGLMGARTSSFRSRPVTNSARLHTHEGGFSASLDTQGSLFE